MAHSWFPRLVTLAIWALAAWSAAYWALHFAGHPRGAQAPATLAGAAPASEPGHVARVFGPAVEKPAEAAAAAAPVIDPSTRFALVGVVANRARAGVALLSVEGKPARPYRVGSTVDEGYTLKGVTARSATLATVQTGATFTVELAAAAPGGPAPVPAAVPGPLPALRGGPAGAASSARSSS